MTPKEKAEELVRKYVYLLRETDSCLAEKCENSISCQHSWYACEGWLSYAKQCALIAVDELIETHNGMQNFLLSEIGYLITSPEYWEEVKQEIEKL